MPITIRYFLFPIDSATLYSSATGEPLSKDSCSVLAAESSVSKLAIVLSNVLHQKHLKMTIRTTIFIKMILPIKEQIMFSRNTRSVRTVHHDEHLEVVTHLCNFVAPESSST
jgi:hypothetical protein